MKALTIRQPWASLIALGVKTIETRGWSTKYRGPLLVHAAMRMPDDLAALDPIFTALECADVDPRAVATWGGRQWHEQGIYWPRTGGKPMPLGAVVATCTLADVVPMVDRWDGTAAALHGRRMLTTEPAKLLVVTPGDMPVWRDVTDQRPYGDFSPGRYAWLLTDIEPLPEPIPAKGKQGLWTPDAELCASVPASLPTNREAESA